MSFRNVDELTSEKETERIRVRLIKLWIALNTKSNHSVISMNMILLNERYYFIFLF